MHNLQMECTDGGKLNRRAVFFELTSVISKLQAVSNKSAFCLKTHEGLTHEFDFVIQQWRKDIGPSTHVILGKLDIYIYILYIRKLLTKRTSSTVKTSRAILPEH